MKKLNIIINKKILTGFEGESILEMSRRCDIEIPTLCHDPRLDPYSSCYLCVVEVEGMRGLQPACSTKITEGMRIETDNARVKKSRKFALELLVSNHYADCVAPCKETCPAGVDVQGYISLINQGKYSEATGLIKKTNPLPAICGRVCVRPCELACRRNLVDGIGVGIDYLKRYTTDKDFESDSPYQPEIAGKTGKRVAIIGAGPGGLSAAWFLASKGHWVEIFEASEHAGGMLRYGIPPYRLPNDVIDAEVKAITDLGVKIRYNKKLGKNLSYKSLKENFNAVILAIGSQKGSGIGCENDDAGNIFSGIDFLRNMEMTGQKYDFKGKKIGVIGGGNTAMDCCRTAMRCGSEDVTVIYRRTEKEMPANPIEIHESKLEGIKYNFLTAPARVNKDENGNLKSLTCVEMKLGEPDASGRRRPVKIAGSEFDLELDFILAAIGQKTNVDFIENISEFAGKELKLNKWGDIDADEGTLQTSIGNIFACGDGVTGPATLIEAIAQGRKAAHSCNQFLNNEEIKPEPYEFISKRDNFKKQDQKDYTNFFLHQDREEMPTLNPEKRLNFDEVELGYSDQQALEETHRCLECGCLDYYECDLKKYATRYGADQKRFGGEAKSYHVNFSDPYIEIDNNKCILCGRCVRICNEVVGANALGLVNRGFETFVAPSMGQKLSETHCESCGMCISTCPTGAISENVIFKAGPLPTQSFQSVCNYCGVGCEVAYHHHEGFFTRVSGSAGKINPQGNICKLPRFGYSYLNDKSRITQPHIKKEGKLKPASFEEAFRLIASKINESKGEETAVFAGARLSNEEMYQLQKMVRTALATNQISSFHYLDKGAEIATSTDMEMVPFTDLEKADHIYLLQSEINKENGVAGFYVYNASHKHNIPLTVINTREKNSMSHKATRQITIQSPYYLIKSIIHHLLETGKENKIYLDDHVAGFEYFRDTVLAENFDTKVEKSGCSKETILQLASEYNMHQQAVMVVSEENTEANTLQEIKNLGLITGKTGKNASGFIILKSKNNAHGLLDMGIDPALLPGGVATSNKEARKTLSQTWETDFIANGETPNMQQKLQKGNLKNILIFGEDPVGTALEKEKVKSWIEKADFLVVQDHFLTETAELADVVLPASFIFETGGSFTNTQKFIQHTSAVQKSKTTMDNLEQIEAISNAIRGKESEGEDSDVMVEIAGVLQKMSNFKEKNMLINTTEGYHTQLFNYGCDYLYKRAEEEKRF